MKTALLPLQLDFRAVARVPAWASAVLANPAPNNTAVTREYLWNRSNMAPLTLCMDISGFVRGHLCGAA